MSVFLFYDYDNSEWSYGNTPPSSPLYELFVIDNYLTSGDSDVTALGSLMTSTIGATEQLRARDAFYSYYSIPLIEGVS